MNAWTRRWRHKLRRFVTALGIGNVGKRRDAAAIGHAVDGHAEEGCCDVSDKPRSHDTSRIAWVRLMAPGILIPLTHFAAGHSE